MDRIHTILTGPAEKNHTALETFLYGLSRCYGGVVNLRAMLYRRQLCRSKSLACPVISVGNLTVGGTGKTPFTIYLARRLTQWGYRVAVISRGYKGRAEKQGGVVSDGKSVLLGPEAAGDEPVLMAMTLAHTPVVVGADRFEAGRLALDRFDPDVLVLDDAFQHLQLARDINLVLLDWRRPLGNTHLLPRGVLREPVSALARADGFVFTRCGDALHKTETSAAAPTGAMVGRPVFRADHEPYCYMVEKGKRVGRAAARPKVVDPAQVLKGRRGFGFSGLARNRDFQKTVVGFQCRISGFLEFSDHHRYSHGDLESIRSQAVSTGAEVLITTEKDFVRISHLAAWPMDLVVVGVKISLGPDGAAFDDFIRSKLDGFVKRPISALHGISNRCGVLQSTPHNSKYRKP